MHHLNLAKSRRLKPFHHATTLASGVWELFHGFSTFYSSSAEISVPPAPEKSHITLIRKENLCQSMTACVPWNNIYPNVVSINAHVR